MAVRKRGSDTKEVLGTRIRQQNSESLASTVVYRRRRFKYEMWTSLIPGTVSFDERPTEYGVGHGSFVAAGHVGSSIVGAQHSQR